MASPIKSIEILEPHPASEAVHPDRLDTGPYQPPGPHTPSLHITVYAYGDLKSAVLGSYVDLANTISESKRYASLRTIREDALISRSRCRATKFFLDDDKDVWLQLDHDIQFQSQDLYAIAEIAHQRQAVVCIPYSCRSLPPRPAHRPKPDAKPLEDDPRLTPVLFVASGAVAIPRQALEQALHTLEQELIPHPYRIEWCQDEQVGAFPSLWMPMIAKSDKGNEYLSEDYAASARLALVDVPQLAYSPRTPLRHWGDLPFQL